MYPSTLSTCSLVLTSLNYYETLIYQTIGPFRVCFRTPYLIVLWCTLSFFLLSCLLLPCVYIVAQGFLFVKRFLKIFCMFFLTYFGICRFLCAMCTVFPTKMLLEDCLKNGMIVYHTQKTCRFINGRFCFLLKFYKHFSFGDSDNENHSKNTSAPEIFTS